MCDLNESVYFLVFPGSILHTSKPSQSWQSNMEELIAALKKIVGGGEIAPGTTQTTVINLSHNEVKFTATHKNCIIFCTISCQFQND